MVLLGYRIDKIIFDYYKIKKQAVGESFELPPLVFLLTEKLIIIEYNMFYRKGKIYFYKRVCSQK